MKTIATAATEESMIELLNRYWYTTNIKLVGDSLPFEVHNSKGKIQGVSIVKHRTGLKCIRIN